MNRVIKQITFAVLLSAAFVCNPADAQSNEVHISADAADQMMKLELPDGSVVVIDNVSQRMYFENSYGQSMDLSFSEIANQAPGTPTERAQFIAQLRAALTDPSSTGTLTTSPVPRLAIPSSPGGGLGGGVTMPQVVFPGAPFTSTNVIDGSSNVTGGDTGGMWDWLGGPCDLSPCTPYLSAFGNIFYMQDSHTSSVGEDTVTEQEYWTRDYKNWEEARVGRCADARSALAGLVVVGVGFLASCAAAGSGVLTVPGVGACFLTAGAVGLQWDTYTDAMRDCSASYPNPGSGQQ